MQLKFRFFEGIVIAYIISKKTRFCCVYEKTCYGPIAKMLFLNISPQIEADIVTISWDNSILVLSYSFKVSKYISECWPR